jgi:polysaccharide deacetylase family protein (PEP-CTERM system associated)
MNPLTIDVEDYYSLVVRDKLGVDIPVSHYVDGELQHLLDVLDELQVRTTCFVVGQLARQKPHLVQEIERRGHEIASHGYEHRRMDEFSPSSFSEDLKASLNILQDITGKPVSGYRAAAFSLSDRHDWAFPIMAELGIAFDSSVRIAWPFGIKRGRDLCEHAGRHGIQEYPSFGIGGYIITIPCSGGGALRLFPVFAIRALARLLEKVGCPYNSVYLHPYDLNAKKYGTTWPPARSEDVRRLARFNFLQFIGRNKVAARLEALCGPMRFKDEHVSAS